MAQASRIDDAEVVMIEEHVDTGLAPMLASYQPPYTPGGSTADEFDRHFRLHASQPLPFLNHEFAKAFEAEDLTNSERKMVALVCESGLPTRSQSFTDCIGLANPHFMVPIAAGTVRCSHLNEARHVMFFDRPNGQPLSELLASGGRVHESKIMPLILEPACTALTALRERKIHHGNIHPALMFLGETPMLGECFSAPANTLSHYLYQPVEYIMTDTFGRGEASEKGDIYALGIMVLESLYGLEKLKAIPKNELIERILRGGTFNVLSMGRDFPEPFMDFFRGTLNENVNERWGLDQLAQFIGGKRYNMIAPTPPKEAARPFVFRDEQLFSRRLVSYVLHRNWRDVVRDIRTLKIERWCEAGLHRPEMGEKIERAIRNNARGNTNDRQSTEMMMRILAVLDPAAPIRTRSVATRPDGIPMMFASVMNESGPERNELLLMIDNDITSYWMELLESNKTPEMSQLVWKYKRIKGMMGQREIGFGMERALYELNPSLPCQSPLVKAHHVTSIQEMLSTLDTLSKRLAPDTSLIDRHIAAFLAAKMDMTRKIRLDDLTSIPSLAENEELMMIRLLSKAQQKCPKLKLTGLCIWSGMRIEKMFDEIHNRIIRKRQKLQLKKLASTGMLRDVLSSIVNREVVSRDTSGFAHAVALYDINTKRLEYLENPMILQYKARKMGGKAAVTISYIILAIMAYNSMVDVLGI